MRHRFPAASSVRCRRPGGHRQAGARAELQPVWTSRQLGLDREERLGGQWLPRPVRGDVPAHPGLGRHSPNHLWHADPAAGHLQDPGRCPERPTGTGDQPEPLPQRLQLGQHQFLHLGQERLPAEFEVTYGGDATPLPAPAPNTRVITCGTLSGTQVTCKTLGYATGVRLVRDLSNNRCRKGSSWGNTDSFIWANRDAGGSSRSPTGRARE